MRFHQGLPVCGLPLDLHILAHHSFLLTSQFRLENADALVLFCKLRTVAILTPLIHGVNFCNELSIAKECLVRISRGGTKLIRGMTRDLGQTLVPPKNGVERIKVLFTR